MARLDIELDALLAKKSMHEKNPAETAFYVDPDLKISIGVRVKGDVNVLKELGMEISDTTGNLAFGTINFSNLKKLADHPEVISIDKQRHNFLQLHDSIPDIMANNVWTNNGDNFTGYTGKDVIVGIIDSGIDFRHKNFRKPDGSTRILRIWDQTIVAPVNPPLPGESPPGAIVSPPAPASLAATLGYGVEYLRQQITDTINDDTILQPVRHKDDDSHGTHVAGIAAGNGKQAGGCHGEHYYIGVAPDADIIMVRLWGLSKGDKGENMKPPLSPPASAPGPPGTNNVIDAIKYIINAAINAGKPAVINCSFGLFSELMDGTDPTSVAIDTILTANSNGHQIVFAAGNDGDAGFHAVGTVPASGSPVLALEFLIYASDDKDRSLAITYTGSNLEAQVISPVGGANGTVSWVTLNNSGNSSTANGTIAGGTPGTVFVSNNPNRIGIQITPPKTGAAPPVNGTNVANTATAKWRIELRNTTATPTAFHAWCLYGSSHDRKSPKFLNNTTTNSTMTQTATCKECVTVGSYQVGGQLAASSGRGPTLNIPARPLPDKPDLCAPGVDIQSTAIAKEREDDTCANCCCECCQDWYVGKGGTSMAAPHITGTIALMLHKNPNLPHTQIKTLLTTNANGKPGDAPPADTVGWGTGKVSAMNSVSVTTQVNPPVAMVASPAEIRQPILQQFLSTEFGSIYYGLGQKYFREILNLINTNKRVATAWHRSKGPVWTRIAMSAFYNPEIKIPLHVGGRQFRESLDEFVVMLKKFASPEMLFEIERCEPHVDLVQEGMTMTEMMLVLGNQPLPAKEILYSH